MKEQVEISHRIAAAIVKRCSVAKWPKSKQDAYAIEAAYGALAACIELKGDRHLDARALAGFAFGVSMHGMPYVRDAAAVATGQNDQPEAQAPGLFKGEAGD